MGANVRFPTDATNILKLADWLELLALRSADGNASAGDLHRELKRLGAGNWEAAAGQAFSELEARREAAPRGYPFTIRGTLLEQKNGWRDFVPYVFCLLVSSRGEKAKPVKNLNPDRLFERLACEAARAYLGGKVLRFGSPRDELPTSFREAVNELCRRFGEGQGCQAKPTRWKKDDGLDVVAWKPFPDGLSGKVILFGQCATGEDWAGKMYECAVFRDIWIERPGPSPILRSVFIPHRVERDLWDDYVLKANLLFDRCRIADLVRARQQVQTLTEQCTTWCTGVFDRMKA